jgi:hypothetical protein
MKRITRPTTVLRAALGVLVCAAATVWAQNPHFIRVSSQLASNGDLQVIFKEAGLGDTETTYVVSADATVTSTCLNNGGQCPQAANKRTFTEEVTATGTFSPKNGNVVATLTAPAPGCPESDPPTCPNGQVLTLFAITYSGIQVTDVTHNVGPVPARPSSLSATFFTCP